jgi:DNA sulfur modification protein DndC
MAFNFKQIKEEITDQYLHDNNPRPWIVGFSGGKDSTMLLQLVWYTLETIPSKSRTRKVYVVCNNTLVENPKILEYTEKVLNKIQRAAAEQSMPITVHRTIPKLEDTFWVNLIGKGYPAPNNVFRWCTERMKINPTTQFIREKVNEEGETIILLGTRSDESSNRAKSIKKYAIEGQRLRNHILPNAYVYAPIKDVLTDELWQYLAQVPSPWGVSNKELITLYRNANSGDCPLVIDDTTPSCGNSRFGCWICTVVNRDKSMEALVENGEDWMEPLMELRNILAKSRDDENCRERKRRNGMEKEGILGPYQDWFRVEVLKKLLQAQKEIQKTQPNVMLINYQELVAIQVTWYRDNIFNYKVADIYNEIFGTQIELDAGDQNLIREKEMLKESCKNERDFELVNKLLALQKTKTILMNNRGIQSILENQIEQFICENTN